MAEHLSHVVSAASDLGRQTAQLAKALSRPEVRGRYGEIQLRRVAELAGMVPYCDFLEQQTARDGDGAAQRPDMVVRLPNDRVIVVDAKANLGAYLDAAASGDDAEREAHLERFARHIADQAKKLGDKKYWRHQGRAPDFVVMFVPGDQFIDAALARRPELIEQSSQAGVILASPSTLIGLLRAVAVGWGEHAVNENARALLRLATELHERAVTAAEHTARLGRSLTQAVNGYNDLVGSIESRLLPAARRMEEHGAKSGKEIEGKPLTDLGAIDARPRLMHGVPRSRPDVPAREAGERGDAGEGGEA
jgi:DNA recombination protein RmuC